MGENEGHFVVRQLTLMDRPTQKVYICLHTGTPPLILNLDIICDERSASCPGHCTPVDEPLAHTEQEAGWPQE
jgi:hypothetical protein